MQTGRTAGRHGISMSIEAESLGVSSGLNARHSLSTISCRQHFGTNVAAGIPISEIQIRGEKKTRISDGFPNFLQPRKNEMNTHHTLAGPRPECVRSV